MRGVATFRGAMTFPFGILSASVTYDAPSLSEMRVRVSRDLRDTDNKAFSTEEIDDLISHALTEVSQVYPKEATDVVTLVTDTYRYGTLVEDPFRVELVHGATPDIYVLQQGDGEDISHGWEYFAGVVNLPRYTNFTVDSDPDVTDLIRIWGYAPRLPPTEDDDLLDVDAPAERAVRINCQLNGYQRLVNDRVLFSQWNSDSSNTDVSLSQLTSLAQVFESQWDRERRSLRRLRRS